METRQRILIYGNSVILGALGTTLRRCPHFEVITLLPPLPEAPELTDLKPDIILFDLESNHNQAVFSVLQNSPGLLLVGVSPDKNKVQMWSGRQLEELSIQGLLETIDKQLERSALL